MSNVPDRQKYPSSIIKVGAVIFSAAYFIDEKTGKAKTEVQEWVVRSIRKKRGSQTKYGDKRFGTGDSNDYVNLALKTDCTWGKRSTKNGDYGWLTVPNWAKDQFRVGGNLPFSKYTTKRAALNFAKKSLEDEIKWYEDEIKKSPDAQELISEMNDNILMLNSVKRTMSRLK